MKRNGRRAIGSTMLWLLTRFAAGIRKFYRLINRWRFDLFECPTLESVDIGACCVFHSPVRVSGGAGILEIGDRNNFGFPMATKLGNGALLLQPRQHGAHIIIGHGNLFSNNVALCANELIRIGDNCQIGDQVAVYDCDFHEVEPQTRNRSHGRIAPVIIGNNVWIGSRVLVLKGVTIGDNSVIGAMSLVTESIPPNCVAAGVPAQVIRRIGESKLESE
ncbi:MAG: acyltransferase [Syntrophobacteraceae bacterium]